MKSALILATCVAAQSGENWMGDAASAIKNMSENMQARARWEGDVLK
jgi:hypothetical protein